MVHIPGIDKQQNGELVSYVTKNTGNTCDALNIKCRTEMHDV